MSDRSPDRPTVDPAAKSTTPYPKPEGRAGKGGTPTMGAPFRPPQREAFMPTPPGRVPTPPSPMAGGRDRPRGPTAEHKKLLVGRDIELAGAISACDTLVVEGNVETELSDAIMIEVAQSGTFKGKATVDHAEIGGLFDGELTVRKKLTVLRSGRVRGTVRYATLEVEAGGQLNGTVEPLDEPVADVHHRAPRRVESGDGEDGTGGQG